MEDSATDLGVCAWRCSDPRPGLVSSLVDEILEFFKCLGGDTGDALLISHAVGIKAVPHVGARFSCLLGSRLAWEPAAFR